MMRLAIVALALLVPSVASAYGPDCQATAELHYAIAEGLELVADAAYEDAIAACGAEASEAYAAAVARECATGTGWHEYAPGGWVAVCGDDDGNALFTVRP